MGLSLIDFALIQLRATLWTLVQKMDSYLAAMQENDTDVFASLMRCRGMFTL